MATMALHIVVVVVTVVVIPLSTVAGSDLFGNGALLLRHISLLPFAARQCSKTRPKRTHGLFGLSHTPRPTWSAIARHSSTQRSGSGDAAAPGRGDGGILVAVVSRNGNTTCTRRKIRGR